MADETRTNEVTELVQSEIIDELIMQGARHKAKTLPYLRWKSIAGASQAAFPRQSIASVSGSATEGVSEATEISATTYETTETTLSPSKLAYRVDVTEEALEDNKLGESLFEVIVQETATQIAITFDHQVCDLFPSFSASAGATNTSLDAQDMADGFTGILDSSMEVSNGEAVYVLHANQYAQLVNSDVGSTATTAMQYFNRTEGDNGSFMNNPIVIANNVGQEDGNVGAVFIRGDMAPERAALGAVTAREPQTKVQEQAEYDERWVVTTARWGAGVLADESGTKVLSQVS